jgi:hypothetical protein
VEPINDEHRLTRLETVLFGIVGIDGGLMKRMADLEARVNTLSFRLILFIGVGSAVVSKGSDAVLSGVSLLVKHLM